MRAPPRALGGTTPTDRISARSAEKPRVHRVGMMEWLCSPHGRCAAAGRAFSVRPAHRHQLIRPATRVKRPPRTSSENDPNEGRILVRVSSRRRDPKINPAAVQFGGVQRCIGFREAASPYVKSTALISGRRTREAASLCRRGSVSGHRSPAEGASDGTRC